MRNNSVVSGPNESAFQIFVEKGGSAMLLMNNTEQTEHKDIKSMKDLMVAH